MEKSKYFILAFLVFLSDQISKWAVSEHIILPLVRSRTLDTTRPHGFFDWFLNAPDMIPYAELKVAALLNFVMVWNRGVSFGMFNNDVDYTPYVLSILSLFITIWFLVLLVKSTHKIQNFGIALIIGGALGNIYDRLRFGAVIDFIDIHIYGYHWPAFNLADSAIVIGVFILAIHLLFFEKSVQTKHSRV